MMVGEAEGDGDGETDAVSEGEGVGLGDGDALGSALGVGDGEGDTSGLAEVLGDGERDALGPVSAIAIDACDVTASVRRRVASARFQSRRIKAPITPARHHYRAMLCVGFATDSPPAKATTSRPADHSPACNNDSPTCMTTLGSPYPGRILPVGHFAWWGRPTSSGTIVLESDRANPEIGGFLGHARTAARAGAIAFGLVRSGYSFEPISCTKSTSRLENPHSLSYQPSVFTRLPIAIVESPSRMHECGSPTMSLDTIGSSV